jgi:NAD(P)-dependent dehydrogenase (short-subunit alcohol dehydrogenase family)
VRDHQVLVADLDPMTQVLHTARFREEYLKAIPMNRYGSCGEIASAVMYLVSEDARYVTGISMGWMEASLPLAHAACAFATEHTPWN